MYIPSEAHYLHPFWVVVDKLAFSGSPLFPQTADVKVLVLNSHPLSFEPYQHNVGIEKDSRKRSAFYNLHGAQVVVTVYCQYLLYRLVVLKVVQNGTVVAS